MADIQATTGAPEAKQTQEAIQPPQGYKWAVKSNTSAQSRTLQYHDAELKYSPIFSETLSLVARHASTAQTQMSTLLSAKSQLQILVDKDSQALNLLHNCENLANQCNNGALCAADRATLHYEFSMMREQVYHLLGRASPSGPDQKLIPVEMTFQLSPTASDSIELITAEHLFHDLGGLTILTPTEAITAQINIENAISCLQTQIIDIQSKITKISIHLTEQERLFNPAQRLYEILNQYS